MRRFALHGMAVLIALVVIGSGARSLSAQRVGFGVETPTGYQVSNVKYWLGDNATVRSVDFDLDAPASHVTTHIVVGGPWYECTTKSSTGWTCPIPPSAPVEMNAADTFQVRAY
jgi:hypothetical protein